MSPFRDGVSRLSSRSLAAAFFMFAVLLAGATSGCGARGEPEGESAAGARARTGETPISLELVTRIGCADCGGDEQLTPTAMALFDDGTLAVLDRFEPFVRIFAPDGEPVGSFGAPGQGPGELGSDLGGMYFAGIYLLPWPNGELSVLELMPAVLETFAADGTFGGQEELDLPMAAPGAQAFAPAIGTYLRHSYVPLSELPDVIERCVIDRLRGSQCGQLTTVTALTGTQPDGFRASLAIATTPSGELVVADTATYRLWVLDGDGRVARQFGRDIPLPPKSVAELEVERAANRDRLERGRAERDIDPGRGHISPAGLQIDGAGRTWVLTQRYTEETSVFDVFDATGSFLGEVVVEIPTVFNPNRITPFVAAGDRLAMMADRPDGSTGINVYRITQR